MPKIDELYAKLQGYRVFSTLDLRSGYYHIGLSDSTKPKTAFAVSGMGKYEFNRVPFRLAQAPAYFQKLINEVLTDCKLESIAKMPTPQNAKQVKQFLGLVGYYRKFVPCFADISRPLTQLT